MVTRKSLSLLAGITLVLIATAVIIGNTRHHALKVIADVAWWGFVLCFILLMVASVATIVRHRARPRGS